MSTQQTFQDTPSSTPIMTRYTDAYRVAKTITGLGETIKILGFVVGGLVFLANVNGGSSFFGGGASLVFGLILGGIVACVGFVLGVLLSAQGQILKATLDTAVNSCPFLQNEQRAAIMSLP
ncbi:MAG: hypothetical protein P4L40_18660 [Terracidiphilus sp.]|nr:hypothetical protein [Terracidiphilus sp.]